MVSVPLCSQGLAYQRRYSAKKLATKEEHNPTPINIPTLVLIINASATLTCSAQIRPWKMAQNSCRQVSCSLVVFWTTMTSICERLLSNAKFLAVVTISNASSY